MQRHPYQLFIYRNGQQYNQLNDLQNQLLSKYPDIRIQNINRLSAINPQNVNQLTLILILNKFMTQDTQFEAQLDALVRNRARCIVYPSQMLAHEGVQYARSRDQIVGVIGGYIGGQVNVNNSSLTHTKNLSDLYLSKTNHLVMYLKSKNKNFNVSMSSLTIKYKDYPIEIKEITNINQVRKATGRQIIFIVSNWEADQLNSLVRVIKNDPSQTVHSILYITEGPKVSQAMMQFYDFSTNDFNEIQYLIDASLGKTLNSNIKSSSSLNSSQFRSVNQNLDSVHFQNRNSGINQINQGKMMMVQNGNVNNNQGMNPQMISHQVTNTQINTQMNPQMNLQTNPQMMNHQVSQQISQVQNGLLIPEMANAGQRAIVNNQSMATNMMPISPVRPISSGPMPNSQYFPNQNMDNMVSSNMRPQSAHPQMGHQAGFSSNVPGIPSPITGSSFSPGGKFKNQRIQLLSAKKVQRELSPAKAPFRNNLLILDNGSNPQFTSFYSPIVKNSQIIRQIPSNLQFQQPTTILAPYEIRNQLYQFPQNLPNLAFVLYSPILTPDVIVRHNLIQLSTSNPREFQTYLQSKGIATENVFNSQLGPNQNNIAVLPRMARITSSIEDPNIQSIDWSTFPSGPGTFVTTKGANIQPHMVNQNMYQNQTVAPISFNPQSNMLNLRGGAGIDESIAYPMQPIPDPLDIIYRILQQGRANSNQHYVNEQFANQKYDNQQLVTNQMVSNIPPPVRPQVIHYQKQTNLNQSSQVQEMVINFNRSSQLHNPPAPQGGPLIIPSGVQRQTLMKSQNYEVPLVVDESNIKNMNTPLLVMPTVPQSRMSNIESQISRKKPFNGNLNDSGTQSINFVGNSLNYSHQKYTQIGPISPQIQTNQLGYTFGDYQMQQNRNFIQSQQPMIQTLHPTQVPYPSPNQYLNQQSMNQTFNQNVTFNQFPPHLQGQNSSLDQRQVRPLNLMNVNERTLNIMVWTAYFDRNRQIFLLTRNQNQNMNHFQQNQFAQQNSMNQLNTSNQQFNQINENNFDYNQNAMNKVLIITPTPLIQPPILSNQMHGYQMNQQIPSNKMSQLSYESRKSNETSINQMNPIRSRFAGPQPIQVIQYHSNQQNSNYIAQNHQPNPNIQTLAYQQNINSQISNRFSPIIRDNQHQDFTPKEIGAMIFNMNSNPPFQQQSLPHQVEHINYIPNNNINNIISNEIVHNQIHQNNFPINVNTSPVTSNITQPYPISPPHPLNVNISSSQTLKRKVVMTDQGTSPIDDYFPVQNRVMSPLRRVKLTDMEIQLSPTKPNLDRFPTVFNPRFSNVNNTPIQMEPFRNTYTTQHNVISTQIQRPISLEVNTSHMNRTPQYQNFDSPPQTRRVEILTSQPTLPKLNSPTHVNLRSESRFQSPGRIIQNKLFNNKDFEMRVENGITVYSRRSNRLIPQDSRARSLSFSPHQQHQITFQGNQINKHFNQRQSLDYSNSINNIVVDVRKSFYSPQPRISNQYLNGNDRFNRVSKQNEDIIVDLTTKVNPNHLMTNALKTVQIKNGNRQRVSFSPRVSGSGETYINSLMSNAKQPVVTNSYAHKLLKTSNAQQTILISSSNQINPSFLNVIYPYDEVEIESALQKRLKNINHIKYRNKDTLFKCLRQSQGESIIIASIPFDRNVQQIKGMNPSATILVFKGNPNLVRVDGRTLVVNSYPEILAEVEKRAYRK